MVFQIGRVAELADAKDLGSFGEILAGSTPVAPTNKTVVLRVALILVSSWLQSDGGVLGGIDPSRRPKAGKYGRFSPLDPSRQPSQASHRLGNDAGAAEARGEVLPDSRTIAQEGGVRDGPM